MDIPTSIVIIFPLYVTVLRVKVSEALFAPSPISGYLPPLRISPPGICPLNAIVLVLVPLIHLSLTLLLALIPE